ncbi:hypothetical protein VOLCADRAFT_67522 [Volvox carteri f. nagariensis]|uniref:Alpha-1,3/1,6-mannosyltransferase ALG2 n=1 Tax=Volvox carteri f. nagariensis TaxID=3068 RepID=D8UDW1_VOLCA|nr:uncharacterized protein VOLCADRAFT_67522 [Volvox carteri f. nagariensis]EFJ42161.1 hypothetical protein VOLCADRAFT_67522 [Volvox carteri f. nagariensis]|eukprot:XP_002956858.1 hypothetical protein VOLCADRAFT_67522 [Volvox carteri f. nagariensis]
MAPKAKNGLRVAFIHPDLGIGGAERLVVDAATELVRCGNHVDMYTAYYDPKRCFEETKTGGFAVFTAGSWFPRHVYGRMLALCAYVRCVLVALHIAWRCYKPGPKAAYDVVIADQVAVVVPIVKLLMPSTKVLFYCHFPDLLLTKRESFLKKLYRAPLDYLEEATTGAADLILVNSKYTRSVFAQTFRRLAARAMQPGVLYPALEPELAQFIDGGTTFLSINRFERKKGIRLALEALCELRERQGTTRLVVAGGYDPRLPENVEYLKELREAARQMGLLEVVRFMPSFTDRQRTLLLAACRAVLYTPQHEHFGIVPLEAMAAGRPVVACDSGGPTESVTHGAVGFLCAPAAAAFASAMAELMDAETAVGMGRRARAHVEGKFSRRAFGEALDGYVRQLRQV